LKDKIQVSYSLQIFWNRKYNIYQGKSRKILVFQGVYGNDLETQNAGDRSSISLFRKLMPHIVFMNDLKNKLEHEKK